jgi:hypothetical protein
VVSAADPLRSLKLIKDYFSRVKRSQRVKLRTYLHLRADCLDNGRSTISHNAIGLLQRQIYLSITLYLNSYLALLP